MKTRLHASLLLALGLAACEKPQSSGTSAGETPAAPRVTRSERPSLDRAPDARKKLRAELTTASDLDTPTERDKAIAKVAWDALELDPELSREAMDQLPPDSAERIRLIQHVAMRMAEENIDEALAWAASLGTDHEQAAAFCHIALVLADTDPERAAHLLSESGVEGRSFDVVAVQVLGRWAETSPADAAAWVVMFPPGKSREAGIRSVLSQWVETDAAAVFSWMATVEDESVREETARAMAMALLRKTDDVRAEWMNQADPRVLNDLSAQWEAARRETGE